MKNSLERSLKIVFQLLAVVFLCATELFGHLSPYMKLINIVFVFPLVLIYIFYLNNEYNKNTKLIVLGILFFKVVPIIVAGNLMSGNYYLIGSADSGFVIQIETELFFLENFFRKRQIWYGYVCVFNIRIFVCENCTKIAKK